MATITWDDLDKRIFENGIDRGVLYQSDNKGVPWNGLTSVSENPSISSQPVYFDGLKINELFKFGNYAATINAITYPQEFLEYQGYGQIRRGFNISDQPLQKFGLSYRTLVGDALNPDLGYKLHIVYNLTAVPSAVSFNTLSDDAQFSEFSWDVMAIPNTVEGYRASSHFILDSRYLDPAMLEEVEQILYGTEAFDARLPSTEELLLLVGGFYVISVEDNGDGTWTATSNTGYDDLIDVDIDDVFTITGINATYLDSETYQISDTYDEIE